MLKGKQRSYLKSIANGLPTMSQIGKDGITDEVISHIDQLLEEKELVKIHILKSCPLDSKAAGNEVAGKLKAEFVQAVGGRFTIYRRRLKDPEIKLP